MSGSDELGLAMADLVGKLKGRGITGMAIVVAMMNAAAAQALIDGATEEDFSEAARISFRRIVSAVKA